MAERRERVVARVDRMVVSSSFVISRRTGEDADGRLLEQIFNSKGWWYRVDGVSGDASLPLRSLERKLAAAIDYAAEAEERADLAEAKLSECHGAVMEGLELRARGRISTAEQVLKAAFKAVLEPWKTRRRP